MDFNAFPQYTACHHSYHICHDEMHDRLLDDLEMHFIELEKIRIGDIRTLRKSEQWIAVFFQPMQRRRTGGAGHERTGH